MAMRRNCERKRVIRAEFERSMIRQRVHAGLKRAVDAGKQLGRPRLDPALEKRIQSQLRAGKGILKVAAECGVGSGTVQRIKREMEEGRLLDGVSEAA
jgi:DNA invertase Pin-like site-specific DNA recombinase